MHSNRVSNDSNNDINEPLLYCQPIGSSFPPDAVKFGHWAPSLTPRTPPPSTDEPCVETGSAFNAFGTPLRIKTKQQQLNNSVSSSRSSTAKARRWSRRRSCSEIGCNDPNCGVVVASSSTLSIDMGNDNDKYQTKKSASNDWTSKRKTFLDNLLKVSNFASLLCVIDCTVLPAITVIFPLIGLVGGSGDSAGLISPETVEWLDDLGHTLALSFVLPVAGLATTMNYVRAHQQLWIASVGWLGMVIVFLANHHCHTHHQHHDMDSPTIEQSEQQHSSYLLMSFCKAIMNGLHENGLVHRIANLSGCALLLSSNYLSHRASPGCADPKCNAC